jgi:hypothetical protein
VDTKDWILAKSYVEMSNNLAIHLEALDACPIGKYAKYQFLMGNQHVLSIV